jgi:hypothetical protein
MRYNLILYLLISVLIFLEPLTAFSQHNKVPPFQIIQSDGKIFKAANLPIGKPIVIIYFSPECEDCQQLTKELLNRIKEFNNTSIAMITNLPVDKVKKFVTEYHLDKYSNIFTGTEGNTFFVGRYYNIGQLPFMALYNKNGDLIKVYYKDLSIEDLLIHLRDL